MSGNITTAQQVSEGVMKEIVREAEKGATQVKSGDKISVHCTGSLANDNQKFWSTKDPGQFPFEFIVGKGKVIKGWDEGCLTMKKGEIAKFNIASRKGYGARGFAAWRIPSNADLIFEIELLTINGQ